MVFLTFEVCLQNYALLGPRNSYARGIWKLNSADLTSHSARSKRLFIHFVKVPASSFHSTNTQFLRSSHNNFDIG